MILNKGINQLNPPKYSISFNSFEPLFHLLLYFLFELNIVPLHSNKSFPLSNDFISQTTLSSISFFISNAIFLLFDKSFLITNIVLICP